MSNVVRKILSMVFVLALLTSLAVPACAQGSISAAEPDEFDELFTEGAISGVEDDGIQVELSGTASTGQKPLHEEEDTGNFYMEDGTLTVAVYDYGGKHVKVDGSVVYGGGKRTFTTTPTSIEDLQLNNGETTVAYDLSGRRIDRAQGIAIVRQGGKTRKVLLKK